MRVAAAAADAEPGCAGRALPAQLPQSQISRLFRKGAEGRPFAADQRVDRVGAFLIRGQAADAVIAADLPGGAGLAVGQGPHCREAEDDLLAPDRQAWEYAADHAQQVVDFVLADDRLIGIVDANIGGADHDALEIRQDQDDSAIVILEENLAVLDRRQ